MKILYQLTRYAPLSFSLTLKYDIHDINIMQTNYENQVMGLHGMGVMGLLIDPIPNSPN